MKLQLLCWKITIILIVVFGLAQEVKSDNVSPGVFQEIIVVPGKNIPPLEIYKYIESKGHPGMAVPTGRFITLRGQPKDLLDVYSQIVSRWGTEAVAEWRVAEVLDPRESSIGGVFSGSLEGRRQAATSILQTAKSRGFSMKQRAMLQGLIVGQYQKLDQSYFGPLDLSIFLLGELKAEESVPILVNHLDFVPVGFPVNDTDPPQWKYRSAVSLAKIGEHSIGPMLNIISQSADRQRRELAAWVIMLIDDKGESVPKRAVDRLERSITGNGEGNRNVKEAVEFIKNYKYARTLPKNELTSQP